MKTSNKALSVLSLAIFFLSFSSCIKKGRDEARIFLSSVMKGFFIKEKTVVEKYNSIIAKNEFKSQDLYEEIKKSLIPSLAAIRTDAENYRAHKAKLDEIKNLLAAYIDKLDFLMEGLSKIETGLLKNDFALVNSGRSIINDYNEKNERFKEHFAKFLRDYNIKLKKSGGK